jgi:hypothetical protein
MRRPLRHPEPEDTEPYKTTIPNFTRYLFSTIAFKNVKNLSVAFCSRGDVLLTPSMSDWNDDGTLESMVPVERMTHAHRCSKLYLEVAWMDQTKVLKRFTSPLQQLKIDLSNAFYPYGCCRSVPIDFSFLSVLKPKVVDQIDGRLQ